MPEVLEQEQDEQVDEQAELLKWLEGCISDPFAFVLSAYPWGQKGTILEDEEGPDDWQAEVLIRIRDELKAGKAGSDAVREGLQIAVRSGHTIGKTALIAWIIQWFISTREHPQIVVTANTETQLSTKTWRELAKWHKVLLNKDLFEWTATKFYLKAHPETWFAAAIPWSINHSEAFAGTHDAHVLFIFDEASAIPPIIWEVAEGSMGTPGAMWLAFGNPTQNTGRFFECWGKFKHRWIRLEIDARNSKRADKKKIQQWLEDYGEDSDFFRVRVRGIPPRASSEQFIGFDVVDKCMKRYRSVGYESFAKILGVDVARFGDDQTVFTTRQGRKVFKPVRYRKIDTMATADKIVEAIEKDKVDYVMIDGTGVGGGVVDRMNQLGYKHMVIEVNVGEKADDPKKYYNKRSEVWGRMKDYLEAGVDLPDDDELRDDLTGIQYAYNAKLQLQMEKKEDMKDRGLASPDNGDSLAITFAKGMTLPKRKDAGKAKVKQASTKSYG